MYYVLALPRRCEHDATIQLYSTLHTLSHIHDKREQTTSVAS